MQLNCPLIRILQLDGLLSFTRKATTRTAPAGSGCRPGRAEVILKLMELLPRVSGQQNAAADMPALRTASNKVIGLKNPQEYSKNVSGQRS